MLDIFLSVFVIIKQTSNAKIEAKRVAEGVGFVNVKINKKYALGNTFGLDFSICDTFSLTQ